MMKVIPEMRRVHQFPYHSKHQNLDQGRTDPFFCLINLLPSNRDEIIINCLKSTNIMKSLKIPTRGSQEPV
jgi:hypothetical protein